MNQSSNPRRGAKIVLTGGPCAGKTTLAEMLGRAFQHSVVHVPESASLLFTGGFPRFPAPEARRATQRAIFQVQRELEAAYSAEFPGRALVLDRGTVDGAAYWPEGPAEYFAALGTTLEAELARYDHVIYLESAAEKDYLVHKEANPHRRETWEEANALDEQTKKLWTRHPSFTLIANRRSFAAKVSEVLGVVAAAIPVTGEGEPT